MENLYIVDPSSSFAKYGPYSTFFSRTASHVCIQGTDAYMNDLMCVSQGYPAQKHRVTDMVLRYLKEVLPTVSGKLKDSVRLKKYFQGDGN